MKNTNNITETLSEKLDYYNNDIYELLKIDFDQATLEQLSFEILQTFAYFKDISDDVKTNLSSLSNNDKKVFEIRLNSYNNSIKSFYKKAMESISTLVGAGKVKKNKLPVISELSSNIEVYSAYADQTLASIFGSSPLTKPQGQPGE